MTRCTVSLTTTARRDLSVVVETIAAEAGSRVAARWRRRLLAKAGELTDQPNLGARDDKLGLGRRRLVVSPYLIIYEFLSANEIAVLRIVHGARDLPTLFRTPNHD